MPDNYPATPEQQAIRTLAMLCGSLLGTMRKAGLLSSGEQEALLAAVEAGTKAAGPFLATVLDDVRWAAESTPRRNRKG